MLAGAHQNAIWECTRHVLRLRSALREYFPAALDAFTDLAASDALSLLERAPSPAMAAKLTRSQLTAPLRTARRHHVEAKAVALQEILRLPTLRQPPPVQDAYAKIVAAQVRIIAALNAQITGLGEGEFGDDTTRFADARSRKNYSGQSPITRASGRKKVVLARYATNRRLGAALHMRAYAALTGSPGARAYYDQLRGRGIGHQAALCQLANRLVGLLHGCLKTGTVYDENTAWQHHHTDADNIAA